MRRGEEKERHGDASIAVRGRALSNDDFGYYDSRAVQNRKMAVPLAFDENFYGGHVYSGLAATSE